MESFVWSFLYAALATTHKNWTPDDKEWFSDYLTPKDDYISDASRKFYLLSRLEVETLDNSVLKPYGNFLQLMALTVRKFDLESSFSKFKGFDERKEREIIHQYIGIFEELASTLRKAKPTH